MKALRFSKFGPSSVPAIEEVARSEPRDGENVIAKGLKILYQRVPDAHNKSPITALAVAVCNRFASHLRFRVKLPT